MRTLAVGLTAALLLIGTSTPAFAEQNQPTQGFTSEGRNEQGFGGGPHCHVLAVGQSAQEQFAFIAVFPSHTGHANAGGDVFTADPDCNGLPGVQSP